VGVVVTFDRNTLLETVNRFDTLNQQSTVAWVGQGDNVANAHPAQRDDDETIARYQRRLHARTLDRDPPEESCRQRRHEEQRPDEQDGVAAPASWVHHI
jgi:hypothetical protein